MIRICVAITNVSAPSGRALAEAVGGIARHHQTTRRMDMLIRYGSMENFGTRFGAVLNTPDAISLCSNKARASTVMESVGVLVPTIMRYPNVKVPAFGRKIYHSKGRDIIMCRTDEEVKKAHEEGSEYFVSFIPKDREYRVHVFGGEVIKANIKVPNPEMEEHSPIIRNLENGWYFREVNPNNDPDWAEVEDVSRRAVFSLGLDFGAVDLARGKDKKLYVFEVNSAPGLASELTLQAYAMAVCKFATKTFRVEVKPCALFWV